MFVVWRPRSIVPYLARPYIPAPSGLNNYTLAAAAGTFTVTGDTASLTAQRLLTGAAGTFTVTGDTATLHAARLLSAAAGSFTLTGDTATLTTQRKLSAGLGVFTLTGDVAGLTAARLLSAGGGAFAVTGDTATLTAQRKLTAGAGAFVLSGQSAAFRRTYFLSAVPGNFTLTGKPAILTWSRHTSEPGDIWAELSRGLVWNETGRGIVWAELSRGTIWSGEPMKTITKRATETKPYTYDFVNDDLIGGGDTIASVVSVNAAPIPPATGAAVTIGSPTFSGTRVTATMAGGTDRVIYLVTFTILTTGGFTCVGLGKLNVQDDS